MLGGANLGIQGVVDKAQAYLLLFSLLLGLLLILQCLLLLRLQDNRTEMMVYCRCKPHAMITTL